MEYRVALIAAPFLVLAACEPGNNDPETNQDCIDQYSPDDGYGYEADEEGWNCPAAPLDDDDDDAEDCEPPTPESVAAEASDEGVDVDPAAFITREAALCIADLEQMEDGLEGLMAWLVYNHDEQRPCWAVQNLLQESQYEGAGKVLLIDAITGEVLFDGEWSWIA